MEQLKEEYEAWRMRFAANIPLNELPGRLEELEKPLGTPRKHHPFSIIQLCDRCAFA